jgi:hypothetical protein
MTADIDLPVWTITPNWAQGITETLSWLTDVLASTNGTEQRRALRLSPRRMFEMSFALIDQERSLFDLWLHRLGSQEFMVPLFHDAGRLSDSIAVGATAIPFDTTYREFGVGDLAVIVGPDAFTFDKVSIEAIAADGITVTAGGVTRDWLAGTRIHALRRSRISDESLLSALTSRAGQATLQFQLNQANDIADEGEWVDTYGDYPLIATPPNRRDSLDLTFNRNSLLLDNDHGLRTLNDDAGRAFTLQIDNRMMKGREEHWAFRQMLYRLRGQQAAVWLPTFNRDLEVARDCLAASSNLDIKQIGYAYTGGAISGRQHIRLGSVMCKVTGTGAPVGLGEEHLNLAAPLGEDVPAGTFGMFMDTCRLATDDIEILHHTDTDGAAECNLSFRSFVDARAIVDPIDYPLPDADYSDTMCGTPAEDGCVPDFAHEINDDDGDGVDDTLDGGGDGDGGTTDPTVTGSLLMGIVVRYNVPQTGTGPSGPTETPDDVAGAPYKLLVPSSVARTNLLVDFPELATLPFTSVGSTFFYGTLDPGNSGLVLPGGAGPHGPVFGWSGGNDCVWYSNTSVTPATDMWWKNGGAFADWNTYAAVLNNPNAYLSAEGGPYHETAAWWDDAHTIAKTLAGKGAILKFHDFGGVNPDAGPIVAPDTLTAIYGHGNYSLTSFDFKKYYGAFR